MKRIFNAIALCLACTSADAVSVTYDVTYNFPWLRDQGLGAYAKTRAGVGSLTGSITFDETSFGTNLFANASWDLTTSNSTGNFFADPSYSYSSADGDSVALTTATGAFNPWNYFTFSNPGSGTSCGSGAVAPTGTRFPGQQYSTQDSSLRLRFRDDFRPGDANFELQAVEIFGRSGLCSSRLLFDLGYEHTAFGQNGILVGSIRTTGTGGTGTGGTGAGGTGAGGTGAGGIGHIAPVPVPASLPLLLAGLAGFGLLRRKA